MNEYWRKQGPQEYLIPHFWKNNKCYCFHTLNIWFCLKSKAFKCISVPHGDHLHCVSLSGLCLATNDKWFEIFNQ
jgi:hypothetical protein